MRRVLFFLVSIYGVFAASHVFGAIIDSSIFINEFHYDNAGADKDEFVEVVVPATLTDLSSVTLELYNGSNGTTYAGPTSLDSFVQGATVDGFTFYTLDLAMQNGAPDALALAQGSNVLQFLSYEGTFEATNGAAVGLVSTDVGVAEDPSTEVGHSLQLAGSGDSYLDFAWQPPATHTRGALNHNQSFTVPEPASLVTWLSAIGVFVMSRWWRTRR